MNGYNNSNNRQNDDLVDIDFSRNRETDIIRQNEELERERRRRVAAQIRRREIIRQKKIDRLKRLVLAWSVLVFGVIVLIAIIMGLVSLFTNKDDNKDNLPKNAVSEEQTLLVDSFSSSQQSVYSGESTENIYEKINAIISGYNLAQDEAFGYNSLLKYYAKAYASSSLEVSETVKKAVRDVPMFSNGYIWSQENSMRFEKTGSYLYDTNASFISAVAEICKWEASTEFLNQIDVNLKENKDISGAMTVGEKFAKAIEYFFDAEDINGGGIRFNKDDNLVYILTKDNDGTEEGLPSNIFFNYRFGYLDLYSNIMFYEAMNDASTVYSMLGDDVNSKKYIDIAKKNRQAINKTFFKDTRYVGCIDENDKSYDYGFAALNLYAVSSGVADKEKAGKILSWINGDSKVNTDSVDSSNIKNNKLAYMFSTVEANEAWWFNKDGVVEESVAFKEHWLNGGNSFLAGAFGVLADKRDSKNILVEAESGAIEIDKENSEPEIFRILALKTLVDAKFGITVDSATLCINPAELNSGVIGIKNIAFAGNNYGFLFDNGNIYITALYDGAVKLQVSGFEKGQSLNLVTVKEGVSDLNELLTADDNGSVAFSKLFGKNTYLKIETLNETKKK